METETEYENLYREAIGIRWIMYKAGAMPTKSDVENILMERHGIDRYWPHMVMNMMEQLNGMTKSMMAGKWMEDFQEQPMTEDVIQYIQEKAKKSALVRRGLKLAIKGEKNET